MMLKFSDEDWNYLIKVFSRPSMKKILYNQSRDRIIPMMIRVALTNPSLFRYTKYFPVEELKNL